MLLKGLILLAVICSAALCLNNGLGRTPAMGWMTWERYRCITDCQTFPDGCISEELILEMAERMVKDGWLEAGYNYISIDDCWTRKERDSQNKLVPDPERFPSGMKKLIEKVHAMGLKFGIYGDIGTLTCGGYPGTYDTIDLDAATWAEWGVDSLKLDGCYIKTEEMPDRYKHMTKALNSTGRPILYACSWPAYVVGEGKKPNYTDIAENCNYWRMFDDIQDSWDSLVSIINWAGDNQDELIKVAKPGSFNDYDMLLIGDFSLSYEESKVQMAIWSILASPLMMSNDLRTIEPWQRDLLLNSEVLAINQDPLGRQGRRALQQGKTSVWYRDLANGDKAVALLYEGDEGTPVSISFSVADIDWPTRGPFTNFQVRDLFKRKDLGVFQKSFKGLVNPHGVLFLRLRRIPNPNSEIA